MEKKIESLIKEHKIIAILRGVPSEKIVDVAKALYDVESAFRDHF